MIRTYKQITLSENKKRLTLLENFELHLKAYLSNLIGVGGPTRGLGLHENEKAKEEHREINKLIDEACPYIEAIPSIVGVVDENNYLTKGLIYEQDIIDRSYFYKSLVNMTERAIAIYKKDGGRAKQRTYCPLFWIALLIDCLVSLPFEALGKAGFNQNRIEVSFVGKLFKYVFYIISYLFLTVLAHIFISSLIDAGYLANL